MPKRTAGRAQPAHADVWFHAPVWTSRKQRLAVAGVIVAAVLGSVGGAGVTARRVDAAEQHPAGSSSSSQVPGYPTMVGAPLAGSPGTTSPIGLPPTELPTSPTPPGHSAGPTPAGPLAPQLAGDGIPAVAFDAYRKAAAAAPAGCGISWPLLAAIGRVESDHGRFGGSQLYADGTSAPRVIGIPLNGNGTALIRDTDHGALDGDTVYDRAVGPMQFIPSTWATWGIDGNGDGVASPFNIYDATQAAADYLCSAGGNLGTASGQIRAVMAYNHSDQYLATVLSLEQIYASGVPGVTIPPLPSDPKPKPHDKPLPPPVDPGRPAGLPRKPTHKPTKPGSGTHTPPGGGSSTPPPVDAAPTAGLTVVPKTADSLDVVADATSSRGDHGIAKYEFNFGDGSAAVTPTSGGLAEHSYAAAGTYTVTVTVTDTGGHQASTTAAVSVDASPAPALAVTVKSDNPLAVTADASGTKDDGGLGIATYKFDFGDGTAATDPSAAATADHTYAATGRYTVTVTVTDKGGKTSVKTFDVTVTAPTSPGSDTPSDTPSAGDSTPTG